MTDPDASRVVACSPCRPITKRRLAVETAVLLAVACLLVQTWLVSGTLVPYEIASASMAPTLLGPHHRVTCDDCGRPFSVGNDAAAITGDGVCPNCRHPEDLFFGSPLGGDLVLLDRSVYRLRPPRRWEIAAFHPPRGEGPVVKRIVGLPRETIEFRDGDVLVDGHRQRKNLAEQRALAVPVYDASFPPRLEPAPPPRWQAEPGSRWKYADGVFSCYSASEALDWLRYRHGRDARDEPVTDWCGYNQAWPNRGVAIHAVHDLLLSMRVKWLAPGRLVVEMRPPGQRLSFTLRGAGKGAGSPGTMTCEAQANGKPLECQAVELPHPGNLELAVSTFDCQFLVAVNGRTLVCYPWEPEPKDGTDAGLPAIAAAGSGVEISHVCLYRDVYYARPLGVLAAWGFDRPAVLGADEFFCLGDNPELSVDSRSWPAGPGVPRGALLGKPVRREGRAKM